LGLTLAGLINQVVMGGIGAGINRFYSIASEKQDLPGYLGASRRLMGYATGVVILLGLALVTGLWLLGRVQWMGLAVAALIFSVLGGYNSALSGIQNAARQRAIVAFHGGFDAWLKIGLAVAVMTWLGNSSTAVVIGYTCSSVMITFSQLIFLRRTISEQKQNPAQDNHWMRQMWLYSMPLTTWGIFTWMQQASDRWALQTYTSSTEVGQYAVLFQLGYTPIVIATGLVMNFLGPILFQRAGDASDPLRNANVHRISWQMTQLALTTTMVGFTLAFYLHEWLFSWLVAVEYRESSYLLPWVVLAGGLFSAGQILATKLLSELNTSVLTSAKIFTALIGIICNLIGAALNGILGVVIGLITFSIVHFIWIAIISRKQLRN
ncbi:MAG: hypothetical protein ACD_46C00193G0006, partial [uncultured bacterium]